MRLSRKVLMGFAAVAVIAISGALIWGLYQRRNPVTATDLYNTENKTTPDGFSTLPRDYTGLPRNTMAPGGVPPLGPPLPGDLGRPMLNAQVLPGPGAPVVDPERQRIAHETEAARTSHLFAPTSTRERPVASIPLPAVADQRGSTPNGQADVPPADPESILNVQNRKLAFMNGAVDRRTVSPDRLATAGQQETRNR
jgi:type IV secretion system protein VirB10